MKYIKKLNINFNNWEEVEYEQNYQIGDEVILIINNPIYILKESNKCDYITKDSKIGHTFLTKGNLFIIKNICTNKDITYLKFKDHWPWFFAEDFAIYK